jgi:hypothetical protein
MKGQYFRHFLFWFALLACLVVMAWNKPGEVLVKGLTAYSFIIAAVYAGRLAVRLWSGDHGWKLALTTFLLLLLVLGFAGAYGWGRLFNRDVYFHTELLSISIPVAALCMVIGVGLHLVRHLLRNKSVDPVLQDAATYVLLKAGGKTYKLDYNDLLYAEANRNYTKVVAVQQTINTPISFSNFEKLIASPQFIRVHRSFIINKSKFSHIEGNRVFIGKVEIPIGENYKEAFLLLISSSKA